MRVAELFENEYAPKDITSQYRTSDAFAKLAKTIETECSDILAAYRLAGYPLYRGIKDIASGQMVVDIKIRPDRSPLQMEKDWHDKLHLAFLANGLKATRSNSIFCTAQDHISKTWGKSFMIFPKNGWTATIFEDIKDDYVFHKLRDIRFELHKAKITKPQDLIDYIADELKQFNPRSINAVSEMALVIKQNYADILITGESYYAVNAEIPSIETGLLKELGIWE